MKKLQPITTDSNRTQFAEQDQSNGVEIQTEAVSTSNWSDENIALIENSITYHIALLRQNMFDKRQAISLSSRAEKLSRQDLIRKIQRFCIELETQRERIVRNIGDLACILNVNRWNMDSTENEKSEIFLFLDLMYEHCFHFIDWARDPYNSLTSDRAMLRREFKPAEIGKFRIIQDSRFEESSGEKKSESFQNIELRTISELIEQNEEYASRNLRLIKLADKIEATIWSTDLEELEGLEFRESFHARRLSAMIRFNVKRNTGIECQGLFPDYRGEE